MAVLVSQVDLSAAARYFANANPAGILLAIVILAGDRLFKAVKWYPLLRIQTDKLPFGLCIRAYLASYAASFLLPASIGGDMLRAFALGRSRNLIPEVSASIVMERVLGVASLVVANLLAVLYAFAGSSRLDRFGPMAAALVATAFIGLLGPLSRPAHGWMEACCRHFGSARWSRVLRRFGDAYYTHRRHPFTLLGVFVLSLAETALVILAMATAAEAVGTGITLEMLLVVAPITLVAYRLPITYQGLGLTEGSLALLLKHLYGIPPTQALAASVAFRFVELCIALPGAILWHDLLNPTVDAAAARS